MISSYSATTRGTTDMNSTGPSDSHKADQITEASGGVQGGSGKHTYLPTGCPFQAPQASQHPKCPDPTGSRIPQVSGSENLTAPGQQQSTTARHSEE